MDEKPKFLQKPQMKASEAPSDATKAVQSAANASARDETVSDPDVARRAQAAAFKKKQEERNR